MSSKVKYDELARCSVSPTKSIVISECSRGGFTIAQQLVVKHEGECASIFLKGAFHVHGRAELVGIVDAINEAIDKYDQEHKSDDEGSICWDD